MIAAIALAGEAVDDGVALDPGAVEQIGDEGAMLAARSANGTVSVDLRPLAVGRGTYKVKLVLRAGKKRLLIARRRR